MLEGNLLGPLLLETKEENIRSENSVSKSRHPKFAWTQSSAAEFVLHWCKITLLQFVPYYLRCLESRFAVRGSRRFESSPVRSDFKSHDSNRKAKNCSSRCEGFTIFHRSASDFESRDLWFELRDSRHLSLLLPFGSLGVHF